MSLTLRLLSLVVFWAASLLANPPQPPIFTGCPTQVEGNHCDSLVYSVVAIDPNSSQPGYSRNVRYHLISGPGEINTKTGLWKWFPERSDIGQSYEVEIAASIRDTMTIGSENCRFSVRAIDQPPIWNDQGWQMYEIDQYEELVVQLEAYDPDECDDVGFFVYQFLPEPTGSWSLDSLSGEFRFAPEHADRLTRFHVSVAVSYWQGGASIVYNLVIDVGPVAAQTLPIVRIDTISGIRPGETFDLPVWLERTDRDFNAGRFHISYDSRFFELNEVRSGQFLTDCGWNEVEWQDVTVPDDHPGFLNVSGAEITIDAGDDGSALCYRPDSLHAELFVLNFTAANDTSLHNRRLPIRFYFNGCYDDYLIDNDTEDKCIADRVRDADGYYLPLPDRLPSYSGIPLQCFANPYAQRTTTYIHGLVDFADTLETAVRGDCNMDGVAWTLDDRSYFAGYFYGGCPIAYCGCSDPNLDGVPNHISDYWFVFNVVHYSRDPEIPVPALSNQEVRIFDDTLNHEISIANADSICGFFAIFDGIVEFPFMAYEYFHIWNDGDKTYAVANLPVIIPNKSPSYDYFLQDGVLLEYTGGTLLAIQASTCGGVRMPVRIVTGPAPFQVVIETEAGPDGYGVYQDNHEFVHVDVSLKNAPVPIGGFSFLFAYDPYYLHFAMASQSGPLFSECGWEYFTYRTGSNSPRAPHCPSGLVHVVGIGETNNGPFHPDTCNLAEMDSQVLFSLSFLPGGSDTGAFWAPIDFFWVDCVDNTMSSVPGDSLFVSSEVFQRDHYVWPAPPNDSPWQVVTNDSLGFPTYSGIQRECLNYFGPNYPHPVRAIDFVGGGVYIRMGSQFDKGDLDLDMIQYAISDYVMFANYLLYGVSAFESIAWLPHGIERASSNSDVNGDGEQLTIEDFVYLARVVIGDADPYLPADPEPIPVHFVQTPGGIISYIGTYELGAIRLVLDGSCAASNLTSNMDMGVWADGDSTVILIHRLEVDEFVEQGDIVRLLPNICGSLRSVAAATYEGRKVICQIGAPTDVDNSSDNLPDHFALEQNYPNPFNPSTTIEFALPLSADTRVTIYNVMGQQVRTLTDSYLPAGYHTVIWDGRDNFANPVASGVYLYRIDAGDFNSTKKMLLLK